MALKDTIISSDESGVIDNHAGQRGAVDTTQVTPP
jgi:hypothetical protein